MANNKIPRLETFDENELITFIVPVKNINEGQDVTAFLTSRAYSDIMTFILQLNYSIFPSHRSSSTAQLSSTQIWELDKSTIVFSNTVNRLRNLLADVENIIDKTPPDPGPRRFGNISFRKWAESVEHQSKPLLERHLPASILRVRGTSESDPHDELASYLLGSFGSSQRLDYGTGHELSFLAFLGGIWKLGGFGESKSPGDEERGIVVGVIEPYLQLIRRLIKTYTLEPAGSHGVWGLDDHSFLPYIFGSAQYGPAIKWGDDIPTEGSHPNAPSPADVIKAPMVQRERSKNMYFGAIGFIYDVKKGPFWEHSPMLYDISGVPAGWAKINKGMIKMYNVEVLSKFPVVQHFRFGSLFKWETDPNAIAPAKSAHTTNQPTKAPFSTSANLADTTSTTSTRIPVTSTLPNMSSGTSAPWANSTQRSAFPIQQPGTARTPQHLARMNTPQPQPAGGISNPGASMPPPTRAPWTKPPTRS